MNSLHDLPPHILAILESGVVAEYATVSAAGVPIDTPTYYFPADDLSTIDLATGVPNPAKAERARRNAKVGLLIEGRPEEPVIVIRAHAAVRDSDIQSNAIRYLAETGWQGVSHGITWDQARLAVTYWSRIIIQNTPERLYWWDNQAALDGPPQVWTAAPGTLYPASDPAPSGQMKASAWPARDWRIVAQDAVESGNPGHLTVLDDDGFPLPMRVRSFAVSDQGFRLTMPGGAAWALTGTASLTFAGFQTFVGEAIADADGLLFRVERALPAHPSTYDSKQVLQPSEDTRAKAWARLEYELQRRGQSLPIIPDEPPERTRLAKVRLQRIASDAPITGITVAHGNRST